MIKMIFERLKERRKYEGYTQQEVANILNVQRATYAGWETGKDIMPLRQFFKLSNSYQLSLDYLTGLNDDESKVVSKTKFIDLDQVAERMKNFRKEQHLTQKQVADALQTTQSNIHKYETGKCLITTMYALEFSKHFSYPLDKFPCAESLLQFITQRLQAILDCDYPGIIVVETKLRESSDSYVTCKRKGGN